ncbi:MAG: Nit6803 family nitrilase [Planctomycetota bacterium]
MVRAAAVQLEPVLFDREATTQKVVQAIEEASQNGAELVVFPETVVPYYPYFSFVLPPVLQGKPHLQLYEEAVTVPGPTVDTVSEAARNTNTVVLLGVNERDHGSLFNTQLLFDAEGSLVLKRRKITPTYHERMVWGQGDASGLKVVETAVGRIGALACWEHYNPLARYSLMAQHEQIHCAHFPGSLVGPIFSEQTEVTLRHHALESGCFVVNATGRLSDEQKIMVTDDSQLQRALSGGCSTMIISPEGKVLTDPLGEEEGIVYADLDLGLITKRKRMMDSVGHYARPELLSLHMDNRPATPLHPSTETESTTGESSVSNPSSASQALPPQVMSEWPLPPQPATL